MEPLHTIEGTAYPFGMQNCDTDVIISSEWLKIVDRAGLGKGAFAILRAQSGNVFDDPAFSGSPILVAGANFGCGSSREHAAWALVDLGVRVVIAPSFSDIFAGNAFKNGILTVALSADAVAQLLDIARTQAIRVDLPEQRVTTETGLAFSFAVDPFRKTCLIEGLDEIDLTLRDDRLISAHETKSAILHPWQYSGMTIEALGTN